MNLDLAAPLRTAMLSAESITAGLGTWQGEPAIHTRRPVPGDSGYPLIVISPDISLGNMDYLTGKLPTPRRDVSIYGLQPKDYRAVEQIGYAVRDLFHRNRFAVEVPGFHVIDIVASGPIVGPTDDETELCRLVPLMIRLKQLA